MTWCFGRMPEFVSNKDVSGVLFMGPREYNTGLGDEAHEHITKRAWKTQLDYNEESLKQIMTAVEVWQWWRCKQFIAWKSKHWRWIEGTMTMAMRWAMHFSYDVYGTVYRTILGKKARLAITAGDLVIQIRDSVQNNVWYCKTEMSFPCIVNLKVVYSQKMNYIFKWKKNTWFCNFPFLMGTLSKLGIPKTSIIFCVCNKITTTYYRRKPYLLFYQKPLRFSYVSVCGYFSTLG